MSRKSFLFCHPGALGDFILSWPVLAAMREIFPAHEFVGIARYPYLELARKLKLVDSIHDLDARYLIDFFSGKRLPPELGKPDGGIIWMSDPSEIKKILEPTTSKPILSLNPRPEISCHISQYYLQQIQNHFQHKISTRTISTRQFSMSRKDPDQILIHPGSGSPGKNYPPGFYQSIFAFLKKTGFPKVKIILGPVEVDSGLKHEFPDSDTIISGNLTDFIATLKRTLLFIGNDSGAGHLAAILGIPTIAVYKNTDPVVWGIMGDEVHLITENSEELTLKTVKSIIATKKIPRVP
jgi:ADP-heptose:LPS heptosyltransferase